MIPSDITSFYLIYARLQIILVGSIKIKFMRICEKYFKNWQVTMKSKYWQWMEQLIKKKKRERKKWAEQVGFHKKGSSVVHAVLGQVSITSR